MFNLGGMEILVILVVALLVLGPEKLPKFMRTVGKAVGELRRASTEFQRTMNVEISADGKTAPELTETETSAEESAENAPSRDTSPHAAGTLAETPFPDPSPKRKAIPRAKLARRPRSRAHTPDTDMP